MNGFSSNGSSGTLSGLSRGGGAAHKPDRWGTKLLLTAIWITSLVCLYSLSCLTVQHKLNINQKIISNKVCRTQQSSPVCRNSATTRQTDNLMEKNFHFETEIASLGITAIVIPQVLPDWPGLPLRVPSPLHHLQHRVLGLHLLLALGRTNQPMREELSCHVTRWQPIRQQTCCPLAAPTSS